MKIPKKIHYCWLSNDPIPEDMVTCMNTWKELMPGYELVKWDTHKFDIQSQVFVKEAYSVKKWAFAADYIRLYALYTEGGIYLDMDVVLKKSLEKYLNYDFFSAVEYHKELVDILDLTKYMDADNIKLPGVKGVPGIALQAAVMGSVPGHPLVKDCMNFYEERHFILPDGRFYDHHIAPSIYALSAEKFGFKYIDEEQRLQEGILLLPSSIIASSLASAGPASEAIHCCAGSWRPKRINPLRSFLSACMKKIRNYIR